MLRIEPVAAPAVGTDWLYTVPGKYVEDVMSVSATLDAEQGNPTICVDSSGNGNNGTFDTTPGHTLLFSQPGLVAGDTAITNVDFAVNAQIATVPTSYDLAVAGGWCNLWAGTIPTNNAARILWRGVDAGGFQTVFEVGRSAPGVLQMTLEWNGGINPIAVFATGAITPGVHMYSFDYDPAGPAVQFYLDGAPFGAAKPVLGTTPTGPFVSADFGRRITNTVTYDEVSFGDGSNGAALFAAMFAAASVSFAAYTAAVLSASPLNYYHLDEAVRVGGRQPTLVVSDGTHTLEAIPTGFTASSAAGPFEYSWIVALNSNSQNSDGTQISVALPSLVLTGGYTIGTFTPDLGSGDQWSDITIWWDDTLQQLLDPANAYRFPPAVKLEYHQIGATP